MNKHKLSGYCIRGGKEIAERIRKVFEADGVENVLFSFTDPNGFYSIEMGLIWWQKNFTDDLTKISIEQAEAIVYGSESEKTFPREMLVSDDEDAPIDEWPTRRVLAYVKGQCHPWLTTDNDIKEENDEESVFFGYRYARELPETIPYKTAKEIVSKATDKGVNDFEIECKKD